MTHSHTEVCCFLMRIFVCFFVCLFQMSLTMYPWLALNSLCTPQWHQNHNKSAFLCLLTAGIRCIPPHSFNSFMLSSRRNHYKPGTLKIFGSHQSKISTAGPTLRFSLSTFPPRGSSRESLLASSGARTPILRPHHS